MQSLMHYFNIECQDSIHYMGTLEWWKNSLLVSPYVGASKTSHFDALF